MRDFVISVRARFGTTQRFAEFMGVSIHTANSWTLGTRKPSGEATRLLEIMSTLAVEAPHLFEALAGKPAPRAASPRVIPVVVDEPVETRIARTYDAIQAAALPDILYGSDAAFWREQLAKMDAVTIAASARLTEVQDWLSKIEQ